MTKESTKEEMIKQDLAEQVRQFTRQHHLSIANSLTKYASANHAGELPRHNDLHWRGLWQPSLGDVRGRFTVGDELLPSVPANSRKREFEPFEPAVLCHCMPIDDSHEPVGSESRYPDIPDRLDIYFLLRHQFDAIAFAGSTVAAIIRRTEITYPTILKLRDWECDRNGGRYRRCRGRSQLIRSLGREPTHTELERQHATSALRALGLRWPRKPSERALKWPECLEELGLIVESTTELLPLRHRATSTQQQQKLKAIRSQ